MEIAFKAIENQIEIVSDMALSNLGLHNGKTGLAFCYYMFSKLTYSQKAKKKSQALILEVCSELGSAEQLNFKSGLTGIGWGISTLLSNGLSVDYDTDKLIYELDDFLYKIVTFQKSEALSFDSGSLGKAIYFYERVSRNIDKLTIPEYRTVAHKECLILLSDEIHEHLNILLNNKKSINEESMADIARSIMLLQNIWLLNFNCEITQRTLLKLKLFSESYLDSNPEFTESSLLLLYAYGWLAELEHNIEMKNNVSKWLKRYKSGYDKIPQNNNVFFLKSSLNNIIQQEVFYLNKNADCLSVLPSIFGILLQITNCNSNLNYWTQGWGVDLISQNKQ